MKNRSYLTFNVILIVLCMVLAHQAKGELNSKSRQSRSIGSSSSSNMIDHGITKSKIELERKQVQEFMTTKNILKSIMKLIFGNPDEISATSRNVIGILGKVLDILKNSFGQKSRSATGRTSVRDWAEDAANASVSMLQGYVRSVLTNDEKCVQRYLCQASKEASREGRELGYLIASVGGYATSYLLDSNKSTSLGFKNLHDASAKGRSSEDCVKAYECNENN